MNQTYELVTVEFQEDRIQAILHEGKVYVSIHDVCDNIGISFASQSRRIRSDQVLSQGFKYLYVQKPAGSRQTALLDIESIPYWMTGIKVSRARADVRSRILAYQNEARDVLARHFFQQNPSPHPTPVPTEVVSTSSAKVLQTMATQLLSQADLLVEFENNQKKQERQLVSQQRQLSVLTDTAASAQAASMKTQEELSSLHDEIKYLKKQLFQVTGPIEQAELKVSETPRVGMSLAEFAESCGLYTVSKNPHSRYIHALIELLNLKVGGYYGREAGGTWRVFKGRTLKAIQKAFGDAPCTWPNRFVMRDHEKRKDIERKFEVLPTVPGDPDDVMKYFWIPTNTAEWTECTDAEQVVAVQRKIVLDDNGDYVRQHDITQHPVDQYLYGIWAPSRVAAFRKLAVYLEATTAPAHNDELDLLKQTYQWDEKANRPAVHILDQGRSANYPVSLQERGISFDNYEA